MEDSTSQPSLSGLNRRRLVTGAATVGAAAALAALWRGATDRVATAQTTTTLDLLNLGLTGEYLMCSAYEEALEYDALAETDIELVSAMLAQTEHNVGLFKEAIEAQGGEPVMRPGFTYPEEAEHDRTLCLQMLDQIQMVTIQGWQGVVPLATEPGLLEFARLMGITKARQCAALCYLLEAANPFPSAIEQGRPLPEVLQAIEQYRGTEW
jgi:ferritin-like protein